MLQLSRADDSAFGEIFHGSKLVLRTCFKAMFLISQSKNSISALKLKRQLGVG
jgi:hypothetical protein